MNPWLLHFARRWPELRAVSPPGRNILQRWLDEVSAPWGLSESASPSGSYEDSIAGGTIPTRHESWHDVFNVLAFVRYPRAKRALHERVRQLQHVRRMEGHPRGRRCSEGDALTILDEATLLIVGSAADMGAFRAAREQGEASCLERALDEGRLAVSCFGHALLEHLQLGRPPIGAGVLEMVIEGGEGGLEARVDAVLAGMIEAGALKRPAFAPTIPWPSPLLDRQAREPLW